MADGNEHIQKYKSRGKVRIDELATIEIVLKCNGLFIIVWWFWIISKSVPSEEKVLKAFYSPFAKFMYLSWKGAFLSWLNKLMKLSGACSTGTSKQTKADALYEFVQVFSINSCRFILWF